MEKAAGTSRCFVLYCCHTKVWPNSQCPVKRTNSVAKFSCNFVGRKRKLASFSLPTDITCLKRSIVSRAQPKINHKCYVLRCILHYEPIQKKSPFVLCRSFSLVLKHLSLVVENLFPLILSVRPFRHILAVTTPDFRHHISNLQIQASRQHVTQALRPPAPGPRCQHLLGPDRYLTLQIQISAKTTNIYF